MNYLIIAHTAHSFCEMGPWLITAMQIYDVINQSIICRADHADFSRRYQLLDESLNNCLTH